MRLPRINEDCGDLTSLEDRHPLIYLIRTDTMDIFMDMNKLHLSFRFLKKYK